MKKSLQELVASAKTKAKTSKELQLLLDSLQEKFKVLFNL
jgi:hypothetical protein